MNISLSQDRFYSLNINENIGLDDIITYYLFLLSAFAITSLNFFTALQEKYI